ncbi:hypothetical protein BASA50_007894 [Batrachochytrium salamandrivorans]|uniref:Seipin n=1 Tax=Batrachochytrium salamandrivorans TaxID=1357716 RepID=A0ABQ8F5Q1_9FUNG|nr:hypothetical protein BASA50_007894 [Batrachochytrium salamandrivorans]
MDSITSSITHVQQTAQSWIAGIVERLTSESSQRMALSSVVFGTALGSMTVVAVSIYSLFYIMYMPQAAITIPFYLQYPSHLNQQSQPQSMPSATVNLSQFSATHLPLLTPEQHYSFTADISIPDSDANFKLGNFMVSIELLSKNNDSLAQSIRPAMVRYKSSLFKTVTLLWKVFFIPFGGFTEAQQLSVCLVENYVEKKAAYVDSVVLFFSDPRLQTYQTNLRIETHFQGLSYFMYHWWLTTSLFFISFILLVETLLFSSTCSLFSALFVNDDNDLVHNSENVSHAPREGPLDDGGVASHDIGLGRGLAATYTDDIGGSARSNAAAINGEFSNSDIHDDDEDDGFFDDAHSDESGEQIHGNRAFQTASREDTYDLNSGTSNRYGIGGSGVVFRGRRSPEYLKTTTQLGFGAPVSGNGIGNIRRSSPFVHSRYGALYSLPYESPFPSQSTSFGGASTIIDRPPTSGAAEGLGGLAYSSISMSAASPRVARDPFLSSQHPRASPPHIHNDTFATDPDTATFLPIPGHIADLPNVSEYPEQTHQQMSQVVPTPTLQDVGDSSSIFPGVEEEIPGDAQSDTLKDNVGGK